MMVPTKYLGVPATNIPPIQFMDSEVVMLNDVSGPPLY
jgi:hypothetical protein